MAQFAAEVLTFKLALPANKLAGGDFHDKFGIFTDEKPTRYCAKLTVL